MSKVISYRIVNGKLQEKRPSDVGCPAGCSNGWKTTVHGARAQCVRCSGSGKVRAGS